MNWICRGVPVPTGLTFTGLLINPKFAEDEKSAAVDATVMNLPMQLGHRFLLLGIQLAKEVIILDHLGDLSRP